jgi:hydroxymethylglutaryl-CoA lyase
MLSFVSPKWVPQLADAKIVMNNISRHDNITYSTLTPNVKGFKDAVCLNMLNFYFIIYSKSKLQT